mmetsp:Transcript_25807/g.78431  ORF Transcript_25807/g.78431 Transcript_25807/m.78431 type:complete len:219 (-) Transcript_25807:3277-3933(-)
MRWPTSSTSSHDSTSPASLSSETVTSARVEPASPVRATSPLRSACRISPARRSSIIAGTRLAARKRKRSMLSVAISSASEASATASSVVAGTVSESSVPMAAVKVRRTSAPRIGSPPAAEGADTAQVPKLARHGVSRRNTASPAALRPALAPSNPAQPPLRPWVAAPSGDTQAAERRTTHPTGSAHSKSSRSAIAIFSGRGAKFRGAPKAFRASPAEV